MPLLRYDTGDLAIQLELIRLWEHRASVSVDGARPWLMRTTHNLCIDQIRRGRVRSEIGDGDEIVEARPDAGPGPQRLAESGDLRRLIDRALEALSPDDRAVIVMREVQGCGRGRDVDGCWYVGRIRAAPMPQRPGLRKLNRGRNRHESASMPLRDRLQR